MKNIVAAASALLVLSMTVPALGQTTPTSTYQQRQQDKIDRSLTRGPLSYEEREDIKRRQRIILQQQRVRQDNTTIPYSQRQQNERAQENDGRRLYRQVR